MTSEEKRYIALTRSRVKTPSTIKPLFWHAVLLLAGVALALAGLALADFLLHPLAADATSGSALVRAVVVLVLTPLNLLAGLLIIRRVPGNIVGPLLIVWTGTVAYFGVRDDLSPWLFALYYWFDQSFGWLALFLMLLHFPDGTLYPARAARWFYPYVALNVILGQLRFLSLETLQVSAQIANPYHLPALQPYQGLFLTLAVLTIAIIVVLALALPALRYRQGSHRERQQIKWLVFFGLANALYVILGLIALPLLTGGPAMDAGAGPFAAFMNLGAGLYPPLGIAVAVLRYRLWDIDVIIRRTLVYSLLTALLSLVYFGSVLLFQELFQLLTSQTQSPLATVLSTLLMAALFTSFRRRIQDFIDRRFYRRKYDRDRVLAAFSVTLREEVSLDRLTGSVLGLVQDTLQPEHISLWVRDVDRRPKQRQSAMSSLTPGPSRPAGRRGAGRDGD